MCAFRLGAPKTGRPTAGGDNMDTPSVTRGPAAPLIVALEPRLMYDGAVAVDVAQAGAAAHPVTDSTGVSHDALTKDVTDALSTTPPAATATPAPKDASTTQPATATSGTSGGSTTTATETAKSSSGTSTTNDKTTTTSTGTTATDTDKTTTTSTNTATQTASAPTGDGSIDTTATHDTTTATATSQNTSATTTDSTTSSDATATVTEGSDAGTKDASAADTGTDSTDTTVHDTSTDGQATATTDSGGTQVVFVDAALNDYQALVDDTNPGLEVHVIQSGQDGLDVMAQTLDGRTDISAVHVLGHGGPGEVCLGTAKLTNDTLSQRQTDLTTIGNSLTAQGDLLLYGCKVADGTDGQALIDGIARITHADVAASTDNTGNTAQGGNWTLEAATGPIEAALFAPQAKLASYKGLLTTAPTFSDTSTTARSTAEDTSATITGITVTDPDSPSVTVTVHATDTSGTATSGTDTGTITLSTTTNLTVSGDGTGTVTLTGAITDLNAALDGMTYSPSANYNGAARVALLANDGTQQNTLDASMSVTPVNDNPSLSPSPLNVNEGQTGVAFSSTDFGLSDPDITTGQQVAAQMIVQIDSLPSDGTLEFNGSPVVVGSSFSYDQVGNLTYSHNGNDVGAGGASDSFDVTVNDGGGGSTTGTIAVDIAPVNTAPSISASPVQYEGQTKAVGLSITDADAYDTPARETVTVVSVDNASQGTLFLDANNNDQVDAGEALTAGSIFTGDQLSQVKFAQDGSEPDAAHPPAFTVNVTDSGGGQGAAHALSSGDTGITIDVLPVDDNPVLATNQPLSVAGGATATVPTSDLQVTDVDSPTNHLVYTMETRPADGVIQVNESGTWYTLGIGGRFTQAQLDAGQVQYVHQVTTTGPTTDSFDFTVRDSQLQAWPTPGLVGAVRDGSGNIEVNTFTIDITGAGGSQSTPSDPSPGHGGTSGTPADNAPSAQPSATMSNTNDGGSTTDPVTVYEGSDGTLNNSMLDYTMVSADKSYTVPASETVYTVESAPVNGVLQYDTTGSGDWAAIPLYGSFTQADIDAGRVRFLHDGGENFISTFDYSVGDGGPNRYTSTFTLDVTPVNDAPVAKGGTVPVTEYVPGYTTGQVRVTDTYMQMTDADGALQPSKRVGDGAPDNLWFEVTSLPTHGTLERWDATSSSWVSVTTSEWLSSQLLTATADGATSGLRFTNDGNDQYMSDAFNFKVRDDLGAPSTPFDVQTGLSDPTNTDPTSGDLSNTATVNVSVAAFNDPPSVQADYSATPITITDQSGTSHTTVNNILYVSEGGSGTITGDGYLRAVDPDNSTVQRQFRITSNTSQGSLYRSGALLGLGSTFTQADLDNGLISYTQSGSEVRTDAFNFTVSDGLAQATGTFNIEVNAYKNDPPTVSGPTTVHDFSSSAYNFGSSIKVSDPDLANGVGTGETNFVQVTLNLKQPDTTTYTAATLTLGSTSGLTITQGTSGSAGGLLVFQGALADVQAAVTNLQVLMPADENRTLNLDVTVDDRLRDSSGNLTSGANGGTTNQDGSPINAADNTATQTIAIQASSTNNAPTITAPTSATVNEDTSLSFTGGNAISVADVDSFDASVTVTVGAGHGTVSAGGHSGSSITLTGTVADVNTALAGLTYQGSQDYNGADTINLHIDDGGNSGSGGALTADASVAVTVNPVNDAPTVSAPGTPLTFDTGTTYTFSSANGNAITVDDARDKSETNFNDYQEVTVQLTGGDTTGALTVTAAGAATVSNNDTSAVTIDGTLADINSTLDGLTYNPTGADTVMGTDLNTAVTLNVSINDAANGGSNSGAGGTPTNTSPADALSASKNVTLDVSTYNDPPVITKPADLTVNEDASVTMSGTGAWSFNDPDAFQGTLKATVNVSHGTLSLVANDGTSVSGSGTAQLILTGTQTQLNNALDGLKYTPNANYHGADSMSLAVDDQGNTGGDGSHSGTPSDSINITVNSVNDRPTATGTVNVSAVNEDVTNPAGVALNTLITDPTNYSDATDNQSAVSGNAADNDATVMSHVAVVGSTSYVAGQGTWQVSDGSDGWIDIPTSGLSASSALVFDAGRNVRFVPAANFQGTPGTLQVRLADSSTTITSSASTTDVKNLSSDGGTTQTGAWSSGSVNIATSVTNVNDRPTSGNSSLTAINEDTSNPAGDTVANLFGPVYSDATDNQTAITGGTDASTSLGGVAIVGNAATAAQGVWQYNSGSGWQDIPTSGLSDNAAVLLATSDQLRFLPAANYNGTPGGLTTRVSDTTVTAGSGQDISTNVGLGQTSDWSTTAALGTSINPVNDAPTLSGTATNPTAVENDGSGINPGTSTVNLIATGTGGASDVDGNPASFGGGSITVHLDSYVSGDVLSLSGTPTGVASTSGGNGADLVINLNASSTEANIGSVLEAVQFHNTSDDPTAKGTDTSRAYTITLNDGNNNGTAGGPTALDSTNNLTGTITIDAKNDPPTANPDTHSMTEDTASVSGNVATNDTDPDSPTLTVSEVNSAAANVGHSVAGTYGTVTIASDGSYTYNLDTALNAVQALQVGEHLTDTFNYTISDGAKTDSTTLTITINGVNDNPVATNNTNALTDEPTGPATGNVITDNNGYGVDSDVEGDTLSVSAIRTGPESGSGTAGSVGSALAGSYGKLTVQSDGGYSYTLNPSVDLYVGQQVTDTFTYTISDGHGGSDQAELAVTITGANHPPVAGDDTAATDQNTPVSGTAPGVLQNDSDPDGTIHDSIHVSQVTNGSNTVASGLAISGDSGGTFTINADGSYTFDPGSDFRNLPAGATRDTHVTYTTADNFGGTDTAVLTVTVTGINDAPTVALALPDRHNTEGDHVSVSLPKFFHDVDQGDTLSYSADRLPPGLRLDANSGSISGTLNDVSAGGYRITITATDTHGAHADATFEWTVDQPPIPASPPGSNPTGSASPVQPPVLGPQTGGSSPGGNHHTSDQEQKPLPAPLFDEPRWTSREALGLQHWNPDAPIYHTNGLVLEDILVKDDNTLVVEVTDLQQDRVMTYSASLGDGSPLPHWLSVDPATGTVEGRPPVGIKNVDLRIYAKDNFGRTTVLDVKATFKHHATASEHHDHIDLVAGHSGAENGLAGLTLEQGRWTGNQVMIKITDPLGSRVVRYDATLADGSPLPHWLNVDPATGTVIGKVPAHVHELDLRVYAHDRNGTTRSLTVKLKHPDTDHPQALREGLPSLARQLAAADTQRAYGDRITQALMTLNNTGPNAN